MTTLANFRFADGLSADKRLPFGLVSAKGIVQESLSAILRTAKTDAQNRIAGRLQEIEANVSAFSDFFRANGFPCPLPSQLDSVRKKGFPSITPLVDALLICEMSNGILMGVQDADRIIDDLVYDVLVAEESFEGMRGIVNCRPREIVLRDTQSIIASYFQGPDKRTSVSPNSTSIVFFVFSAPQLDIGSLEDALTMAAELLAPCASEVDMDVFRS